VHTLAAMRSKRQAILLEILRTRPIRTQEAAVAILANEGIPTTQATLSRDFVALGAVKTSFGYQLPGTSSRNAAPPVSIEFFDTSVRSVEIGETIIVVRTPPAHADAVALRVDEILDPDLLGTIAGDDTVFVATRSPMAANRLAAMLFGYKPTNERS
jgi:transcriptional regulator of arginine metabolism